MAHEPVRSRVDGLLLLEAGLALVLLGLMVVLYWTPAPSPTAASQWWRPALPTAVFFLIVALEAWRRKRGRRLDVRRMMEESQPPPDDG